MYITFLIDLGTTVNSVDGCYYCDGQTTYRVIVAAGDNKVCVWISDTLKGTNDIASAQNASVLFLS